MTTGFSFEYILKTPSPKLQSTPGTETQYILFFGAKCLDIAPFAHDSNMPVFPPYHSTQNMANFFYYESCKGLLVKWKVQHGGLKIKNLKFKKIQNSKIQNSKKS